MASLSHKKKSPRPATTAASPASSKIAQLKFSPSQTGDVRHALWYLHHTGERRREGRRRDGRLSHIWELAMSNLSISELLESRTLLSSAGVSQGVLHIVGDVNSANTITVRRTSDTEITVSMSDKPDQVFGNCDTITKVVIDGGDKADRLAIDESARALGVPVEINGLGGNDTIIGSAGDDTLNGQGGNDSIIGNAGNDRIFGREGNDKLFGGAGNDMIKGGGGHDILDGGAANDSLWGNKGADSVSGDDGNDVMFGGPSGDTMLGGNGDDIFRGGDPRDQMDGGAGHNQFLKR